ncbi:MAG TPA: hypothetical protein VMB18_04255 [Terriglobales bacterium]|nr:hypothetical protein [Terriglobales bacterium]
MLKTFLIPEQGLNAMYANGTRHLVIAKGLYSTSDPEQQIFLRYYPGITLISTEPDQPKRMPDNAFPPVQPVIVTNTPGLQMKEKQTPTSGRITAGKSYENELS